MFNPSTPPNTARLLLLATVLVGCLLGISSGGESNGELPVSNRVDAVHERDQATGNGQIFLNNGGFVHGRLQPADQEGVLGWQADMFTKPFDFQLKAVKHVNFDNFTDAEPPTGEFAVELASHGRLFGHLVALSANEVVLETVTGQRLHIERGRVQRLVRATPELRRLRRTNIDDPGRAVAWEFDFDGQRLDLRDDPAVGARSSDDSDAQAIGARFGIPESLLPQDNLDELATRIRRHLGRFVDLEIGGQCVLELDVRWDDSPQFDLALGVDHRHDSFQQAFRLEVWDGELVLIREFDDRLHMTPVLSAGDFAADRRWRLLIELDQRASHVAIRDRSGELLAEMNVPVEEQSQGTGVRLRTADGTQVTQLAATSNTGDALAAADQKHEMPAIVLESGEVMNGEIMRLDEAQGTIAFQQQNDTTEIPLDQVRQLILKEPDHRLLGTEAEPDGEMHAPLCRAVTAEGWYLYGQWGGVHASEVSLHVSGVRESIRIPLAQLDSLSNSQFRHDRSESRNSEADRNAPEEAGGIDERAKHGRLIGSGVMLHGKITESEPSDEVALLYWHPNGSRSAAPLRSSFEGRIAFPPRRSPWSRAGGEARGGQRANRGGLGGALAQLFGGKAQAAGGGRSSQGKAQSKHDAWSDQEGMLFLRSGDTVPCQVVKTDRRGITFSSPTIEQGFVPHEEVKSVILADLNRPKQISATTRERLLMVPRARRDDPPTHLICSRTGDFLRGRLVGMDEDQLRVEVRLETRRIDRDLVAQIFWMHPEDIPSDSSELTEVDTDEKTIGSSGELHLQARRADGTRISFDFQACRDEFMLVGHNSVLGECQVDVRQVDQLLLGVPNARSLEGSPLADWRLHHAPIPKAFLPGAGEGGGEASGTESSLVGNPAPEFELELLGGETFHLGDSRGRVVVLDFWASWCGPCIQAMPQIEQVVAEFPETEVELIGVNLQEQPATISATLERLELDLTVALDRTGGVAEQYGVTAIPQTVIIDPDGNVARLYVGIHTSLAQEMHDSISELLSHDSN